MPFDPITGRTTGGGTAAPVAPSAPAPTAYKPDVAMLRLAARILRAPKLKRGQVKNVQKYLKDFYATEIEATAKEARLKPEDVGTLASLGQAKPGQYDVGGLVSTPLDILGRPEQAVAGGIAAGPSGAVRGLTGKERFPAIQAVLRATGKSQQEAAKAEASLPGPVRFTGNLAGSVALDPLSYLSFGVSGLSRGAVGSVAPELAAMRGVEVADAAASLSKNGLKALTTQEIKALTEKGVLTRRLTRELRGAPGGIKIAGRSTILRSKGEIGGISKRLAGDSAAAKAVRATEEISRTQPLLRQAERSGELLPGTQERVTALLRRYESKATGASGRTLESGLRLAKGVDSEARLRIGAALEQGPEAVAKLAPNERAAAEGLSQFFREASTREQVGRGLLQPDEALNAGQQTLPGIGPQAITTERYFPRFLSPEAQKAGITPEMSGGPLSARLAPNLRARTNALRDLPTQAIKTAEGKNLYETDPFVAYTRRSILANRDVAKVDLVNNLRQITTADKTPFIQAGNDLSPELRAEVDKLRVGQAYDKNFVKKELPITQTDPASGVIRTGKESVLVHKSLAHDPAFDRILKLTSDESAARAFTRGYNKALGLWKGYATVFGPFGGGFALRNFTGNVLNGFYLTNMMSSVAPLHFEANAMRRALEKGVAQGGGDVFKFTEGLKDAKYLHEGLDTGVIGSGFYRQELGGVDDWQKAIREGVKARSANPLSQRFFLLQKGRQFNTAIEETSRLAMFIGLRKRGFSADAASSLVQKYLFDYGELSTVDKAVKEVVPFWTWTRKNVPLQLETLVKNPGKLSHQAAVVNAARGESAPFDPLALANWMKQNDAVVLPFKSGGKPEALLPDTPLTSTYQTLAPVQQLVSNIKDAVTGAGPGDWKEFFRRLVLSVSPGGPGGGFVTSAYQGAAGQELFSGRTYKPGETRLGLPIQVETALENILPVGPGISKIRGAVQPGSRSRLSGLLGQSVYQLNDQTKRNELFRRLAQLQALQQYLQAKGAKIPASDLTSSSGGSSGKFNPITGRSG